MQRLPTIDRASTTRFLAELGCAVEVVAAAERLLDGATGGEPAVLVGSGWRRLRGVLVLAPDQAGGEREALLAAADERALRELLLALPGRRPLRLRVGLSWHLAAVAEVLDGRVADEDGCCFAGTKRGGPPATAAGLVLDRRDPIVDLLRELAQPAGRERHGRFVAEGVTLVRRAVEGGLPVEAVVHTGAILRSPGGGALLEAARGAGVACWRTSDGLLGTITPTRPLPEVIAAVHLRTRSAEELFLSRAATVLVAENLQNPDNLGLLLRTADAAGVEAVVVAGDRTDPLHRNCVRAARGAVGRLPIARCADLPAWLTALRERGFLGLAATAHGDLSLHDADLPAPVVVVVGNEELGVTQETLAACAGRLVIPMAPGQDSLNVAVAAGVVLFELARRRSASSDRNGAR